MEIGRIYFFTATILNWKNLLSPDNYKDILIGSLKHLVERKKLEIYGFVIMPNHIHIIWKILETNGKEMPHASFFKFVSHEIQKDLKTNHPTILELFRVDTETRTYQFWQRDALPIELYTPEVIYQKLDYIHNNPFKGKWGLAQSPELYHYSSFRFYETAFDDFGFLTHIGDVI